MPERRFSPVRSLLVGRDAELDRMQAALDQARDGEGRLVLISGEPGIGKTRLVEELVARAVAQGACVAWGRVDDMDGAPPYWPWVQLLEGVLDGADRQVIADALGGDAGPIAAIVPAVAQLVGGITPPPSLDPPAARFRLHEAVVAFLRRFGAHRQLLLVLEDMHWADVSSLELTRFVAARLNTAPFLVVVTYRSVDGGSSETFDDVLASLARQPMLERIALTGLTESEVGRFIAQTVDVEPGTTVVSAVHARTEGNPFFVGELARLLETEGSLGGGSGRDGSQGVVPTGVRDVVRRRLARLPTASREVLVLGAVIGRDFDLAVLAAAAALSEVDTLDRVGPAIDAGLVSEDGASVGRFRFSHALIRDTVYGELSALGKATLHARVGVALERHTVAGSRLAELAGHFFHAAPVLGPERGLAYVLEAAKAAQAVLAYERAEDDLRRALGLVDLLPVGPDRLPRELHVQNELVALMTVTRGAGAPEVGRACARARQLCQEIGDTDDLVKVLNNLAGFHYVHGDFSVVAELAGHLLSTGEERSNPTWLTAGHLFFGMAQLHTGLLVGARDSFASAREVAATTALSAEVAERFSGPHPMPKALAYSAWSAWALGEESQAHAFAEEGVRLATRLGHAPTLTLAWYMAIQLHILDGSASVALAWSERALDYCAQHRSEAWQTWFGVFRGWAISALGGAQEGVAVMTAAAAVHQASGARLNTPILLALLADGEAAAGDCIRALALVDQALAVRGEDRLWESDLHRRRGELLAALGPHSTDQGGESLRSAISVAQAQGAVTFKRRAEAALAALGTDKKPGVVAVASGAASTNLSPRECELLGLVGRGLTDKEIARDLVISLATVHSHLDRIRDKTGRRRRPELTRLAVDLGLTGE